MWVCTTREWVDGIASEVCNKIVSTKMLYCISGVQVWEIMLITS